MAMATRLTLDPETEVLIDDLMASGRFADRVDVLRHGIRLAHDEDQAVDEPLDAETLAELERRIAEADADPDGGIPAEEVFAELERLCQEEMERGRNAAR